MFIAYFHLSIELLLLLYEVNMALSEIYENPFDNFLNLIIGLSVV